MGCGNDASEGGDQLALEVAGSDGVGYLGGCVALPEAVNEVIEF